ncbi:DUF397 domain-containing protein [Streptomyces sulfonofaciens]|uniref:DUF397 domain-containing protein n=1 Tax=Streptomyces sulfonofaciens TaxID=68272 RepID=A0A919KYV3_9ACTN|nr:DUF397 domain-containing protein [Streptomyces sulfonofaciens]GHH76661.1 DUF397 domain-containing protein [Streptomyces sulfonofaciens]
MTTAEPAWFKSSYSSSPSGDCVEVALSCHRSGHGSGAPGGSPGTATPTTVHVRDSKDKDGPRLTFSPTAWLTFLPYA